MPLTHAPGVLIVDDEPLIRDLLVSLSQDAGFRARAAANAREALETLGGPFEIGIVVADVRMPGKMDGIDLVVELAQRDVHLRFIVTSGHAIPTDIRLPTDVIYLPKPYTETQVIDALRSATSK